MKTLILLFFISTSVLALKPHTANYTLSVSDFEIAKVKIALSETNGKYIYTLKAQTKGVIKLVKDYQISSKSIFTLSQFGLHSQHYQNFERDGDRVKQDIDIHPKNHQVDPLNQTLFIANVLEKQPDKQDIYFLLNDGKSVTKKHYRQTHSSNDNLIKFLSEDEKTEVHFARDKYYTPILIRNKKFVYQLNSIHFDE
ncbi:MAG: hypothetical protein Ctma_0658 [Catillopecten margaritatus gill symbiont]|uniref:DUF3108 domain-containing protein n=1 Tax=Catillopecten margaritatus gill symbiont TaxID=3083288 RepID=A0AAU6PG05_9GAMM